jgi:hypothetical protein
MGGQAAATVKVECVKRAMCSVSDTRREGGRGREGERGVCSDTCSSKKKDDANNNQVPRALSPLAAPLSL